MNVITKKRQLLLISLRRNGILKAESMKNVYRHVSNIYTSLKYLKKIGLVRREKNLKENLFYYTLTKKGERFADILLSIPGLYNE